MLVKYEGVLGKFEYDDKKFCIKGNNLLYIGLDTEDIVVPEGVVDCSYTFHECNITKLPKLPKSCEKLNYTFENCKYLKGVVENLPDGIVVAINAFTHSNVEIVNQLPSSLKDGTGMFSYTPLVQVNTPLPKELYTAFKMFQNTKLQETPKMKHCYNLTETIKMFYHCYKLERITPFPNSILQAVSMFDGCKRLKSVNVDLPLKLRDADRMFAECNLLTHVSFDLPPNLIYANEMFLMCHSLTNVPEHFSSTLVQCKRMFFGCNKIGYVKYPMFYNNSNADYNAMYEHCKYVNEPYYVKSKYSRNKQNIGYASFILKLGFSENCTAIIPICLSRISLESLFSSYLN